MILILEIILTIVAWRKGWRGWALVPVGSVLCIAFMVGVVGGASGLTDAQVNNQLVAILPLELVSLGVLIWMAAKGRKKADQMTKTEEVPTPQVVTH